MKKVLVAGSINIDLTVSVLRFVLPGETIQGKDFNEIIGGKGANQASACALQNIDVTFWGKIGQDNYGDLGERALQSLGINTVLEKEPQTTGIAMIEVTSDGQNRIVVVPGANACFTVDTVRKFYNLLEEHDIVVLQNEIPPDTSAFIIMEAKKLGKTVIVNPAPAQPMSSELLQNIDYLIPNEHELSIVAQMPTQNDEEIKKAMIHLRDQGVGCVITSLGARGLCYLNSSEIHYLSSTKVNAIDTVGAGDSLIGAFAAYLAKGLSLEDALSYAGCAAALSVTRRGAFGSAGSEQEIEQILNNNAKMARSIQHE
ncbi:MAG: ribokinase [Brevinema sp.]